MANKTVEERFAKHRPEYFKNTYICSWITEHDKDVYSDHFGHPCHAALAGQLSAKNLNAVHLLCQPKEADYDNATKFFEYICSPDAPWSELKAALNYDKEGRPWYITVPITDKTPAQLVYFFAILSRHPYEHFGVVHAFEFFRNNGFEDTRALYLSIFINMHADYEKVWWNAAPGAHYAWDWTYRSPISLKRLVEKRGNYRDGSFCKTNGCVSADSSAIWTDVDYKKDKSGYSHYLSHAYPNAGNPFLFLMTRDKYEGAYPKLFDTIQGTVNTKEAGHFKGGGVPSGIELIKKLREKQGEWDCA